MNKSKNIQPTFQRYRLFSSAHRSCKNIDHMVSHDVSLHFYQIFSIKHAKSSYRNQNYTKYKLTLSRILKGHV